MSRKGSETMDHERVSFNLAKLRKGGVNFEVAVDPDLAISYKNGKAVKIEDIIRSEHIFADVKKGVLASESQMKQLFNTADSLQVAETILKEGEIQLTEEYRKKIREEKRRKIVEIIHRGAIDPRTKLPHPPQRIENAMEEAKVKIDEFRTAEDQIERIIKALRVVLPLSFERRKIAIRFLPEFAGKAYNMLIAFGKPQKEEWKQDGSYVCVMEIPAGIEPEFYDKLNNATRGSAETKVVE